jgi:tellurite resistance protein
MIDQTTSAEETSASAVSPQEAFVSLLIASARSDGSLSPHEANQIEHVVAAMQLFRDDSHQMRQSIFKTAAERIREHGVDRVIRAAAAAVPKTLAPTAFAVAVDLMLSDGRLSPGEQRFTDELRVLLNVERDTAANVVEVLTAKNAG